MRQDRRTFIATLGAAATRAAFGWSPAALSPLQTRRLDRVGLQLYTLRTAMRGDPAGTIAQVAAIGYKEVEFAGYNGLTPTAVRDLLAQHKLTSPSTHVGLQAGDAWKKICEESKMVGHEFVTVPSLPGRPVTLDDWKQLGARFNAAAAEAKAAGVRFSFHNHQTEFREVEGRVGYDVLLAETDPALVTFQIDVHWMTVGGKNVLDYLARHPTRFTSLHLKDGGGPPQHQMMDVGSGTTDWKAVLAKATQTGLTHFFVEHDSPADPLASVKASYGYLSKLEF